MDGYNKTCNIQNNEQKAFIILPKINHQRYTLNCDLTEEWNILKIVLKCLSVALLYVYAAVLISI